jgi:ubiquinone biosynthesis monooxygenase Coq7
LTDRARLIRRILRVDHAGEHGAISIYTSQIARARRAYPDLLAWLQETLGHELRHREAFLAAMPTRNAKACRAMAVWSIGGALLGRVTALFGRGGVMICTAAVERTVHRHLQEQIAFLEREDAELAEVVRQIQIEENEHLAFADRHHDSRALSALVLSWIVSTLTELLIFLSTRGDSLRLRSALSSSG